MPYSIEIIYRFIRSTKPNEEHYILDAATELSAAYAQRDAKEEKERNQQRRARVLFAYRGPKRHESRPHHLTGSPVKAEAVLSGQPKIFPWRRS